MYRHPWSVMFRAWCDESGETQNDIAERLGVTQPVVSAWSTGKRIPSDNWQQTIAQLTADKVPTMVDGYRRGVGLCDG